MASVYLDFNKTANGDGTFANAYSWQQAGSNTTANCVVANTISSGDEIRIIGRDYFTHAFPANTWFANSTLHSALQISNTYGSNAIGTANGSLVWFPDVRPESGSGVWQQTQNILSNQGGNANTHVLFDTTSTGYAATQGLPMLYSSFANTTHTYLNSEVKVISLNTSSLIPIQARNDGVVFTTSSGSTYYILYGLKANTSITDNWTAEGVRDTTLNSNNKTILCFSNTSPSSASFKVLYLGGAVGDCGNINFDLRNTVIAHTTGPDGNSIIQAFTFRVSLFGSGTSSPNTALGMSYDIGALTTPYPYFSSVPSCYIAGTSSTFRFATTAQTENFLRIRSFTPAGYIYYAWPQFQVAIGTGQFRTDNNYNLRIDSLIHEGAYVAGPPNFSGVTGSGRINFIFGDIISNAGQLTNGIYGQSSAVNYTYSFGFQLSSTINAASNNQILFDRTRNVVPYSVKTGSNSLFPVGLGISYQYYGIATRFPPIKYASNGTITLSNNSFYVGSIFNASSSNYPGGLGSGANMTLTNMQTTSISAAYSEGSLDYPYKLAYNLLTPLLSSLSKVDFISPIQPAILTPGTAPSYRIFELPYNSYFPQPFGALSTSAIPGYWSINKSIIVDKDGNFGNTSVEYIPGFRSASGSFGSNNLVPSHLPITACTDVVSTGSSLKFMISSISSPAYTTTPGAFMGMAAANSYGGIVIKTIDIPPLNNTATKTLSLYIKKDANTTVTSINVHSLTVNSAYSNTDANNYQPSTFTLLNIANTTLTSTYQLFTNTFSTPSTTGNKILISINISQGIPNGAIYVDNITIT